MCIIVKLWAVVVELPSSSSRYKRAKKSNTELHGGIFSVYLKVLPSAQVRPSTSPSHDQTFSINSRSFL